ncbi:MAG: 3-deoxy-manno-octulosonate cytidylyltransferase [bacterium]|nr:3-deoxy-manno-octulosonate cytidylyltransferase [bacterium]
MTKTLILIPARMQASRLPGKPMADILGEPMIVHVWRRAVESTVGEVVVATDDRQILHAIEQAEGRAIMTRSDHKSGSDRIFEALQQVDPEGRFETIVNLQGDLPSLDPHLVKACTAPLADEEVDIATLGVEIDNDEERNNPNVVKIVGTPLGEQRLRALYFTRTTAPYGEGPHYHHIGIYAYRRSALERFVGASPSVLELREKLEQLRALENDMRIDVALVDTIPLGVDTPADLEKARALLLAAKG